MEIKLIKIGHLINRKRDGVSLETQNKLPAPEKSLEKSLERDINLNPSQTIEMPFKTTAFFSVDKDGNVVIKIVDSEGKVIRQIPPEEYIAMVRELKKAIKNLIDIEV